MNDLVMKIVIISYCRGIIKFYLELIKTFYFKMYLLIFWLKRTNPSNILKKEISCDLLFPGKNLECFNSNNGSTLSNSLAAPFLPTGGIAFFEIADIKLDHTKSIISHINNNYQINKYEIFIIRNSREKLRYLKANLIPEAWDKINISRPIQTASYSSLSFRVWHRIVKKHISLLKALNVLPHARSSSSLLLYYCLIWEIKEVTIYGLDGNSTYYNFSKYWKCDIDVKNQNGKHSTNNSDYGVPTMQEVISEISDDINMTKGGYFSCNYEQYYKIK